MCRVIADVLQSNRRVKLTKHNANKFHGIEGVAVFLIPQNLQNVAVQLLMQMDDTVNNDGTSTVFCNKHGRLLSESDHGAPTLIAVTANHRGFVTAIERIVMLGPDGNELSTGNTQKDQAGVILRKEPLCDKDMLGYWKYLPMCHLRNAAHTAYRKAFANYTPNAEHELTDVAGQ